MNTGNNTTNSGQTGQPTGQLNGAPVRRMLYRSPNEKMVAGVAGGIAEYLGWNPVIVRVIWVVATFATWGGGFLAYLLLAMFLPIGNNTVGTMRPPAVELSGKGVTWAAGLLMGLGGLWLLANLGILPGMWRTFWGTIGILFWPVLLFGAGYLLLRANSQKDIDQEVLGAARKVKDTVGEKLPSGNQLKSGFANVQASMPLRRSEHDKVLLGVCGGIGEKLDIDANLVRLIWVAFALGTFGLGALLYGAMGLLLPQESAMTAGMPEVAQNITIVDVGAPKAK